MTHCNRVLKLAILLILSDFPVWGATLEEAFKAAVQKNERVAEGEQQVIQADERTSQVVGGIFPQLSLTGLHTIQPEPADPIARQFSPQNQTTITASVNQAVFRGLREFAGLRQSRHLLAAQVALQEQNLVTLFQEVAGTYLEILRLEQDLKNLREQSELYAERTEQIQARSGRGESSQSELLTAQSAEAAVVAEMQLIEGQLYAARETFGFVTGLPTSTIVVDPGVVSAKNAIPSLEECLKRSNERPDIRSAVEQFSAAEEAVSVAWGAHLPTIDVYGNYYLARPGFLRDLKWDVGLRVTLPIFEGGAVSSRVREAISRKTQAELQLQRMRRFATQEIRSLHQKLKARLDHLDKLKKSVVLSRKNVDVLQKEFRRGLIRNIDVHLALTESRMRIRGYDQARFAAQLELFQLQAAAAMTPTQMKGALK